MSTIDIDAQHLFQALHGNDDTDFPTLHAPVNHSPGGVPYLTAPGVVVLARPSINMAGLSGFLAGFDAELNFPGYIDDPTTLPAGAQLCKVAGQICYMSLGPKRSMNERAGRYFDNLKSSGHGSVFEHANYSLLLYGVSRSLTHELIRHRPGFGYCLSGDTLIYSNDTEDSQFHETEKHRLDDLYAMTQTPHGRSRLKLLRLRCLDEQTGTFTAGKVKSVVCSGIKPVFTVTLADGKTITATKEHRFLTRNGWKALEDVAGGLSVSASGIATYTKLDAEIMVNGQLIYQEEYIESFGRKPQELNNKVRSVGKNALLIPRSVKIVSIAYTGDQMTYDIEMDGPNHNFVANGIITHNSQLSQRYVSGRMLRFVERPEYQADEQLHTQFLQRIERAASEYSALTERLLAMQKAGVDILSAEARTDLRKKVQQSARSVLPNETETVLVVTGNVRAWRHVIEERGSTHAETEIRALAVRILLCLQRADPVLFDDYSVVQQPDGTNTVQTEFKKI